MKGRIEISYVIYIVLGVIGLAVLVAATTGAVDKILSGFAGKVEIPEPENQFPIVVGVLTRQIQLKLNG